MIIGVKILIIFGLFVLVYFLIEKIRGYFFRYNNSREKFISHLKLLSDDETLRFLGETKNEKVYLITSYHKRNLCKHLKKRMEQSGDEWFSWFLEEYKFYKKAERLQILVILSVFMAMSLLASVLQ